MINEVNGDAGGGELYRALLKEYRMSIIAAKRESYAQYLTASNNMARDSRRLINYERNKTKVDLHECGISPDEFNSYFVSVAQNIIFFFFDSLNTYLGVGSEYYQNHKFKC
ncbi:hypothetical protein QE152_g36653 [Popillia japonica]|uniref:Uncharacterized protein n=1 Tax=Popillia japonica TaxID=7064 RepID=A0AAW1ID25_POPJA